MTNEEIIKEYGKPENWISLSDLLDLARADEREKWQGHLLNSVLTDAEFEEYTGSKREEMQGVDVWVSMDKVDAVISTGEPERYEQDGASFFCGYGEVIETNVYDFAKLLSIERGECAKFKIVRQP